MQLVCKDEFTGVHTILAPKLTSNPESPLLASGLL